MTESEDLGFFGWALLAVVQGLTEFLPVSSSGHLVIAGRYLGAAQDSLWLEVALHVGTLFAIIWVYRRDLVQITREILGGRWSDMGLLIAASLPAAIVGFTAKDWIEANLHSDNLVGMGLIFTGCVLLIGELARRRTARASAQQSSELSGTSSAAADKAGLPNIGLGRALAMGAAQALAILPGISRSGSTITTGMLLKVEAEDAARFSFVMSLPVILGATLLTVKDIPELLEANPDAIAWKPALLGVLISAVVGYLALRFLVAFLGRGAFGWFAPYCLAAGAFVIWG